MTEADSTFTPDPDPATPGKTKGKRRWGRELAALAVVVVVVLGGIAVYKRMNPSYPTSDCSVAWTTVQLTVIGKSDDATVGRFIGKTLDDCKNKEDWWAGANRAMPKWAKSTSRCEALTAACASVPKARVCS